MNPAEIEDRFNPKIAEALRDYTAAAGFSSHLGIRVVEATPGTMTCSLDVTEQHMSGVGFVHGGVIASLVDHTLSLTVYPLVDAGKWVATLEFKINYVGSVKTGTLTATGRIESLRRKLAVVRVDVVNEGETVAVGQGTLYVREKA